MSPALISTAIGLAITVLTLAQVAPTLNSVMTTSTAVSGLSRKVALVEHIIQYKALEGVYPTTVADMTAKNYGVASDNNNGFGGTYTFVVNATKGIIAVSTTISDANKRALYVNNYRHTYKPVDQGGGVVTTTFIMPSTGAMGAPIQTASTANIPVSSTAPSAASNTYWYDTSGSTAMLKVSNGIAWAATTTVSSSGGSAPAPSATTIVANANSLPTTATTGDVRYVFNAANSTLDTLIYYNSTWNQSEVAVSPVVNSNPTITKLAKNVLPIGRVDSSFFYDFKTAVSAITLGTLSDLTVNTTSVKWAVQGTLPSGLSINTATGVMSGTPTAKTSTIGTSFNVLATYNGSSGQQNYIVKVGPSYLVLKSITVGGDHVCGVTTLDGVKCWGRNSGGQLGNGSVTDQSSPLDVIGLTSGVANVSAGDSHTCAVTMSGGLKCWGNNANGRLGDGTTTQRTSPVNVTRLTTGVASVYSGSSGTCAITTSGAAKCWGSNLSGKLGDGTTLQRTTEVPVTGLSSGVLLIAVGQNHTCAIVTGGRTKCWGANGNGNLGDGSGTQQNTPVDVIGLTSGTATVSVGQNHSCIVTDSGEAKCWGFNANGQLGNGTTSGTGTPATVSGMTSGVRNIAAGTNNTCAVTLMGAAKCWGDNSYGALGDGTTVQRLIPTTVLGLDYGIKNVSGQSTLMCGLTIDNTVKCWGSNTSGQLGDGTTSTNLMPVNVISEAW